MSSATAASSWTAIQLASSGLGGSAPRLLGDDQHADARLSQDPRRLGRDGRGVDPAPERDERRRAEVDGGLAVQLAVVGHPAGFETVEDGLEVLGEAAAGFGHVEPEAVELVAAEAPADAEDDPPARHVVEHQDLLGQADGVVPGQHHHHRTELHPPRAGRHPGQELRHVGAHVVVGEVVLGAPHRVEAERLGGAGQLEALTPDVGVGPGPLRVLEERSHTDVHGSPGVLG